MAAVMFFVSLVNCNWIMPERICESGAIRECSCTPTGRGTQTCQENGSGWQECQCEERPPSVVVNNEVRPNITSTVNNQVRSDTADADTAITTAPSFLILNPADDASRTYAFSGGYIRWEERRLHNDGSLSWSGQVNVNIDQHETRGNSLSIQFIRPYYADPICNVNLEGFVGFIDLDPQTDRVIIRLYNINGNPRDWNSVRFLLILMSCHGVI
jgi:hypothetical protein